MNEGIRLKVEGRREYVSFEMGFGIIKPFIGKDILGNSFFTNGKCIKIIFYH